MVARCANLAGRVEQLRTFSGNGPIIEMGAPIIKRAEPSYGEMDVIS